MANTLATITTFINSPPGQLVAGATLGGIVWKFFERVEAVLNEDTKLEIAVWLLGVKVGQKVDPWPDTFARVFDRVFGKKHLSWKCLWRSCMASACCLVLANTSLLLLQNEAVDIPFHLVALFPFQVAANVVPDYISVWATRLFIGRLRRRHTVWLTIRILLANGLVGLLLAVVAVILSGRTFGSALYRNVMAYCLKVLSDSSPAIQHYTQSLFASIVFPVIAASMLTSLWLWLYVGSGFLLKAARRFDIGFQWFNRRFDIEKKPLQSIGLVSGALVAMVYWAAVIVGGMLGHG